MTDTGSQKALVTLAYVTVGMALIATLYWAQKVLVPIALAIFLTFILVRPVRWLQKLHIPRVPAVIAVITVVLLLLGGIVWLLMAQMQGLAEALPEYTENVKNRVVSLRQMGNGGAIQRLEIMAQEISGAWYDSLPTAPGKRAAAPAGAPAAEAVPAQVIENTDSKNDFFLALVSWSLPLLETLGVCALTIVLTLFMLIKREELRDRIITLVGHGRMVAASKAVDDAGERIGRYLFTQLIMNCLYGATWGAGLYLLGVKYALLWGALSAMLRYAPYIGTAISALFPLILSLAQSSGWSQPLYVMGLFVTIELVTANFLEPRFFGKSIGVSEVAMLISAAFWTFLWGVTGLVLSGPMTVCLVVLGKHVTQLRFFAILLGNEPTLDVHLGYYQRLLARDQDEAASLVLNELKKASVIETYDDLILPALTYAKRDYDHELLSQGDEEYVFGATRDIVADIGEPVSKKEEGAAPKGDHGPERVGILACAAHDNGDLLALEMLRQVLDKSSWDLRAVPLGTLTAELLTQVKDEPVPLICIAALPPGGLAHTRYLCKRLRARFPGVKILVGRWGLRSNFDANRDQLLEAGADEVATTLAQTVSQLNGWLPVLSEQQRHPLSA